MDLFPLLILVHAVPKTSATHVKAPTVCLLPPYQKMELFRRIHLSLSSLWLHLNTERNDLWQPQFKTRLIYCWERWKPLLCSLKFPNWAEEFSLPLFVLGGWLSACSCHSSVFSLPSLCGLAALLAGCFFTVVTGCHDWFPLTYFHCDHNVSFTEKCSELSFLSSFSFLNLFTNAWSSS